MFTPERRTPAQKAAWRGSVDADIEMLFDSVTAHGARLTVLEEIVDVDADIAQEDLDFLFDLIEDLSARVAAVEKRARLPLDPPVGGRGGSVPADDSWGSYVWPYKSPYWWNPITWNYTTTGNTAKGANPSVGATNYVFSDD